MMFQMKVWNYHGGGTVVVLGITVAGYYKVRPLPLQTLPFAQPDLYRRTGSTCAPKRA